MGIMSVMAASGGLPPRATLSFVYSESTADATLNVATLGGYRAGKSDITITVNSGVYLWATTITGAGLTLSGGATGDTVILVNNGFIIGKGGNANIAVDYQTMTPAQNGGTALSLGFNTTVNNSAGYIGGGGGGGSGYRSYFSNGGVGTYECYGGGGGAGGGSGGSVASYSTNSPPPYSSPPIEGGAIGTQGSPVSGGRIIPGAASVNLLVLTAEEFGFDSNSSPGSDAGGAGNAQALKTVGTFRSTGGGAGVAGTVSATGVASPQTGAISYRVLGAGGGWGASGCASIQVKTGVNYTPPGGAGGKAVALNGKTITWVGGVASSSRAYGAVS